MIPLAEPNLGGNEATYLQNCIASTFVSSVGPYVHEFEQHVCSATESTQAVAVSSGTTGLHLALTTVGVRPGDLVILPTFTFIASAGAIAQCGAEPWLFDITGESWTLDPRSVERELRSQCASAPEGPIHRPSGRRVGAVLPVYALGLPADMNPLVDVAREFGIPVVADAAAAIGARYRGLNIGGLADLSVSSFNGNKTITCGGGGAVFGRRADLLDRARHLSTTARVGSDYTHDAIGFNYRMTNLQAAVGCAQFERLADFMLRKREIHDAYAHLAGSLPGLRAFPDPPWATSAHWFSGVVLPSPTGAPDAITRLREAGVDARPFWKPIHLQAPFVRCPRTSVDVADDLWGRVLALPSSTGLTDEQLSSVLAACTSVLTTTSN